ncbi:MAG: DUF2071 domain-containing protein [Chloroflexi bacterium]|nr:DUF2071 domain-containing protein [Chloroflexota bacterium]
MTLVTVTRPFLTARWTDVVLASYRVPPELLQPHIPPGSELDAPDDAPGLHLLSLVALRFSDTRVLGVPVPTAQDFPELNLRFYARRGERRAAVFLREFVPVPLVVLGARLLYRQPYHLASVAHRVRSERGLIRVHTTFAHRGHHGELRLVARDAPETPPPGSQAHWLKEHYWGFDRGWTGQGFRYRVAHPVWRTHPVLEAEVSIDPGAILGGAWRSLDWPERLHSVVFADGSAATVYTPEPLVERASEPRAPKRGLGAAG